MMKFRAQGFTQSMQVTVNSRRSISNAPATGSWGVKKDPENCPPDMRGAPSGPGGGKGSLLVDPSGLSTSTYLERAPRRPRDLLPCVWGEGDIVDSLLSINRLSIAPTVLCASASG